MIRLEKTEGERWGSPVGALKSRPTAVGAGVSGEVCVLTSPHVIPVAATRPQVGDRRKVLRQEISAEAEMQVVARMGVQYRAISHAVGTVSAS